MMNLVNENNGAKNKEAVKMTVVELKKLAKELGIKGYSKMNKAALVEVVEKAERTNTVINILTKEQEARVKSVEKAKEIAAELNLPGVGTLEDETVVYEVARKLEERQNSNKAKGMNKLNFGQILRLVNSNASSSKISKMISIYARNAKRQSKVAFKILKRDSKNIDTVYSLRIEFGVSDEARTSNVFVQAGQESSIFRAVGRKNGIIGDNTMIRKGDFVNEVVSIKFDKSLFKNKHNKDIFSKTIDSLLSDTKKAVAKVTTSINLVFSKNGLVKFTDNKNVKLNKDEYVMTYEFLGITPSGLRTKSILAAAVLYRDFEGNVKSIDRRKEVIDKSMDGAFAYHFLDEKGNFKEAKSTLELFKGATRITQGAPGSKVIFKLRNYVIVPNIAEYAKFEGEDAKDITDGNVRLSAEAYMDKYVHPNNLPLRYEDVLGTCGQFRGASLKCSATLTSQRAVKNLVLETMKDTKKKKCLFVVDGKKYTREEFLALDREVRIDFLNKVEMLGDLNAFKLENFNPEFELVELKAAYASDSKLNTVVNMALMFADQDKALKLILRKGKEKITSHFASLGLDFEVNENGEMIPNPLNFDVIKGKNADSQLVEYLYKCDPQYMLHAAPGAVRSMMSNRIQGLANSINELKIDLASKYLVVQSDMGCLYNCQLLRENEVFCPEFEGLTKVSAVRHPISSFLAVSTFNVVTLEEILNRIAKLNADDDIKEDLAEFYSYAKGYAILPGSAFLMEKHDGMDWDIDAMQFILEEEAVEILAKLPNIGSKIDSKDDWQRRISLNAESNIEKQVFIRPDKELTNQEDKNNNIKKTATGTAAANAIKTAKLTYSFDDVCRYAAKEYFLSNMASVGEIATAFYNNADILFALKAGTLTKAEEEKVLDKFRKYYGCTRKVKYVSNVDLTQKQYTINKIEACDILFRFAESYGTKEELEAFLFDCCLYNRYIAETSIDSAKNKFLILNMYNHAHLVKGLGSDKNMKIVKTNLSAFGPERSMDDYTKEAYDNINDKINKMFTNTITKHGLNGTLSVDNYFNLDLMDYDKKNCFDINEIETAEYQAKIAAEINGRRPKPTPLGIESPLSKIKRELVEFANEMIILSSKLLEAEVTSEEAKAVRANILADFSELCKEERADIERAVYGALNVYRSISSTVSQNLTFEEKLSKHYLNDIAVKATRNGALLSMFDIEGYKIGMKCLIELGKNEGRTTLNPALTKVFVKEVIEYLSTKMDNVGVIAEKISIINETDEVKKTDLVGCEVEFVSGEASINGVDLYAKDKKANIEGTIVEEDGAFYVENILTFPEEDFSVGAYISNWNSKANKEIIGVTNFKGKDEEFVAEKYTILEEYSRTINGFTCKYKDVVVAENAEGNRRIEGILSASDAFKSVIYDLDLNGENFKVYKNKNSRCFFLAGNEIEAILNSVTEGSAEDFEMPICEEGFETETDFAPIEGEADYDFATPDFDFGDVEDFGIPQ